VLAVLHEDNHLLVVDKPPGLLTQAAHAGDDTLVERARAWLKERHHKPGNVYVGLVHRLDRSTSGVVVLAKTSKAAARLSEQLRSGAGFDKRYLAIVHGALVGEARRVEHMLVEVGDGAALARPGDPQARRALLTVTPRASRQAASLVEVALETGRKHQIRVQLAALGHPLVGDRRYGGRDVVATDRGDRPARRVMLHAWRLTLTHPTRGETLTFEAPIPQDFSELTRALGLAA